MLWGLYPSTATPRFFLVTPTFLVPPTMIFLIDSLLEACFIKLITGRITNLILLESNLCSIGNGFSDYVRLLCVFMVICMLI